MNKALMFYADLMARPLRWIVAFVDQVYYKRAVVGETRLTPPANVNVYEHVDAETGEVEQAFDWMSFRTDIVPDTTFELYETAFATFEVSGDTDDLNEATKFQVRTILYRCVDEASGDAYWANQNGTRFDTEFVVDEPIKLRLRKGLQGGISVVKAATMTPAEIAKLAAGDIYDAGHRGYLTPETKAISADVPE
jgi:hypothetical protein